MRAPSDVYVVDSGDHSLVAQKSRLGQLGLSQEQLDERALTAIAGFLERFAPV